MYLFQVASGQLSTFSPWTSFTMWKLDGFKSEENNNRTKSEANRHISFKIDHKNETFLVSAAQKSNEGRLWKLCKALSESNKSLPKCSTLIVK